MTGRFVVRVPNWLGDAVMALPALAAVRQSTPAGALVLAARASVASIFSEIVAAAPDEVVVLNRGKEADGLRRAGAGTILLLTNSFRSAWDARAAGIGERWGYRTSGRRPLLTRSVVRPNRTHQIDYYLELVRQLGFAAAATVPSLIARPTTLEKADALLAESGVEFGARLVGFAPGAAYGQAKRWAPARVAAVMSELAKDGIVPVMLGAEADRPTARAVESSLSPGTRIIDLVGRTSLRTLVGVIARCSAFVSNDSGAMHLAAALGVPLTATFGPTDERVTRPRSSGAADVLLHDVFCRPCMLRECPIDHRCMRRIPASDVLASVRGHLA